MHVNMLGTSGLRRAIVHRRKAELQVVMRAGYIFIFTAGRLDGGVRDFGQLLIAPGRKLQITLRTSGKQHTASDRASVLQAQWETGIVSDDEPCRANGLG